MQNASRLRKWRVCRLDRFFFIEIVIVLLPGITRYVDANQVGLMTVLSKEDDQSFFAFLDLYKKKTCRKQEIEKTEPGQPSAAQFILPKKEE
jgi:hypothetical protein